MWPQSPTSKERVAAALPTKGTEALRSVILQARTLEDLAHVQEKPGHGGQSAYLGDGRLRRASTSASISTCVAVSAASLPAAWAVSPFAAASSRA